MATVVDLLENLTYLNVDKEAKSAIGRTTGSMVKLNQDQLAAGVDSEGYPIGKYSSRSYAIMKHSMNPEPGMWNVDLILTGSFEESMMVDVNGDEIERIATDSKANSLTERYGDDIFGLTEDNQEYYNEEVFYPEFADAITRETGLEFD